MAEEERQSGSNGSSTVSDETLRLYLLCRLGEDERLRLDERLLIDDELAGRVLLAESELTDDYAAGTLDSVERELFTRRFLVTDERQRNLRFSSALQDYAGSQASTPAAITQRTKSLWRERLANIFDFNRPPALALAGSFAVLILLVGLAWFIATQRSAPQPVIARHEPIPTTSPQALPQIVVSPPVTPSPQPTPIRKPAALPTLAEPTVPPTIASFVLLPGAIRGGGELPRIALPDGERDIVRLSLVLETNVEGVYRAELATAEGQTVTVRSKLKANKKTGETILVLDIPARILQRGDYQIRLTRQTDGQTEPAGRYYFRALE